MPLRPFAFLAVAAVAWAADDVKAPLAETSRQLDQLQKQPANGATGAEDNSVRSALPSLGVTLQGREALPSTDPATSAKDPKSRLAKKDPNRNWLVDGYDKLDPKANHDKDAVLLPAPAAKSDESENQADPSAATKVDIFSLYATDGKDQAATDRASAHAGPTADPFAPFLQSWLAKTSDRELVAGDGPKSDAGSSGSVAMPPAVADASLPSMIPALGSRAGDAPSNPYLSSLALPMPEALAPTAPIAFPSAFPDLGAPAAPAKPSLWSPAESPLPSPKLDGHKPPPSQADEDRKYFPQLNRF